MDHYDLTRESWLDVMTMDGRMEAVGLRDVFIRAHEFRDLVARDRLERLAILRVLMALCLRAYPDWDATWSAGKFDPQLINDYLDKHEGRFDLFGDTPFYQKKSIEEFDGIKSTGLRPVSEMLMCRTSKAQAKYCAINPDTPLPPAQAARALISFMMYAPGGVQGKLSPPPSTGGAPASHITGFSAIGDSLFSTIMLNSVTTDTDIWNDWTFEKDKPQWEREELTERVQRAPDGTADWLTFQNRVIELKQEDDMVVGFISYPGVSWKSGESDALTGLDPNCILKFANKKYSIESFLSSRVPASMIGGLYTLYEPESGSKSMVADQVDRIGSDADTRFLGYEVACVQWGDRSFRSMVDGTIEDALNVPYALDADPELRKSAYETMTDVFELANKFNYALRYLTLDVVAAKKGLVSSHAATAQHNVDRIIRSHISNNTISQRDEVMKEVAKMLLDEFRDRTKNVPVEKWKTERHKANGFLFEAHKRLNQGEEK